MALRIIRSAPSEWGLGGEVGHALCYADDLVIARAAFKPAVQQWPKEGFRLRHRALILEEHKPKK